jgi:hypothetical protein
MVRDRENILEQWFAIATNARVFEQMIEREENPNLMVSRQNSNSWFSRYSIGVSKMFKSMDSALL